MKLDDFIKGVLCDIDGGLKVAKDITHKNYFVVFNGDNGVRFDIAVTSSNSESYQNEGAAKAGLKAGFVEVVGANIGTKQEDKNENSQVSRIQFTVFVPDKPMSLAERFNESTQLH